MGFNAQRHEFFQALCDCPQHAPNAHREAVGVAHRRWPAWMPRLAFAPTQRGQRGDVLVVIFLRGAADALNMVVPHGEPAYYDSRPTLAIPHPDDSKAAKSTRAVDLDGFFGLHPAMASLLPAWQEQQLAIVHACGAPDDSRSHFKAMELMERGLADLAGPASGWINRHLASLDTGNPSPLRAIGFGEAAPRSLRGVIPVSALRSITEFHLGGEPEIAGLMKTGLAGLYSGDDLMAGIGRETLRILETVERLDPHSYRPASGKSAYPASDFGAALRQVALLVRAEVGLEVAAIDLGGWDTHFAQGAGEGLMAGLLADLAGGLSALHADMADRMSQLTVVVMTEFGRRVRENASLGTDHGHGSLMLLLGGNTQGGRVHGRWPGLDPGQLFGPGDLAVTTDYRDVLAEICRKRLNNPAVDQIFPGFTPGQQGFVR
jgi:uncharacterized protein (DUF1501 family)